MNIKKKLTYKYDLSEKTIINFGDSIFGNARPPVDISTYIEKETGATVYNVGFGGCRMGKHSGYWDYFSMYQLANSIKTGNWDLQDDAIYNKGFGPTYFPQALEILKSIDYNSVDIITIAYGTNDFTGKNAVSSADPYDTTTYKGALRHSIEAIQSAYPDIEIVLCTPTYRFWPDKENNYEFLYDSDSHIIEGQKLTEFVKATKEIATEYGLLCIDNYYGSGICYDSKDISFSRKDGTHPNEIGRQMIAENMAKELYKHFG